MAKLLFDADHQPDYSTRAKRGKGWKAKIIEALERQGKTEEDLIDVLLTNAISRSDEYAMREILSRLAPVPKSVMPAVEFFFPTNGTPVEKMDAIIRAVANGDLPSDIASTLAGIIKTSLEVMETTELVERMEKLEAIVEQQNNGKAPK